MIGLGLVAIAASVLILRCEVLADRSEARLDHALALVVRGLEGEPAALAEAEHALAGAASFTDPYPLFVLEVTRRLRERRWHDAHPEVQRVLMALAAARWQDAATAVAGLDAALPGRDTLARLVTDLGARAAALRPDASGAKMTP